MHKKVIVMSIQTCYLNLIETGNKKVELRTMLPPKDLIGTDIYLYESLTGGGCGKVVSKFKYKSYEDIDIKDKEKLIEISHKGCVPIDYIIRASKDDKRKVKALDIVNYERLDQKLNLTYFGIARAPQSWCYGYLSEKRTISGLISEMREHYPKGIIEYEKFDVNEQKHGDTRLIELDVYTNDSTSPAVFRTTISHDKKIVSVSEATPTIKWLLQYMIDGVIFEEDI